jgi:DNA replication protein DnaC
VKPTRLIVKKQSESEETTKKCAFGHDEVKNEQYGYWHCPTCEQLEKEAEERTLAEEKRKEEEKELEVANNPDKYIGFLGVGKRHLSCSLDNYEGGNKIKEICKDVGKNPCDILLTGAPGSGKTHLAIAIFKELIKNRHIKLKHDWYYNHYKKNAFFITIPDLLLEIRQVFRDDAKNTEEDIVNHYSTLKYLILDDLGSEKTTDWSITTLYTIIDRRYRENRVTIVTTNLTIDQIGSQISDRIASRLSSGKVIKINAPDYRKKR